MEPKGAPPPNRPRNYPLWLTVFDLRNYFINTGGRPNMTLIGEIVWPGKGYSYFGSEWHRRKKWFVGEDGEARLEMMTRFYKARRESVLEALRTGVPDYSRLESKNKEQE